MLTASTRPTVPTPVAPGARLTPRAIGQPDRQFDIQGFHVLDVGGEVELQVPESDGLCSRIVEDVGRVMVVSRIAEMIAYRMGILYH